MATANADPYGMTNKRTGNSNGNNKGKSNRRSPAGMTNKGTGNSNSKSNRSSPAGMTNKVRR